MFFYWLFHDKEPVKHSKLSKPPVRSETFYYRKQDLLRFQTYGWKENMSVVAMTAQVTLVCQTVKFNRQIVKPYSYL